MATDVHTGDGDVPFTTTEINFQGEILRCLIKHEK